MDIYSNISIIIVLAVFINYINFRFIKMQSTIAIMLTSLIISILSLFLDRIGFHSIHSDVTQFVANLNFRDLLMNFMLGFLLFAGSLTIDISQLKKQKWDIAILATISVLASAFVIAVFTYYLLRLFHIDLNFIGCLLFGALISPTDPIAVLSVFKQANAPKKLSLTIAAESLFNDGLAVVLFITISHFAFTANLHPTAGAITLLFLHKSVGGLLFGLALSFIAYFLMKPIDDHKIEILLTLAIVTGGYTLAQTIGVSGPLAMVTVGIFIASRKREIVISKNSREHIETFWGLIDELLNAILFLLIGFEILVIPVSFLQMFASLAAIPLLLLARYITVALPMSFLKVWRRYPPYSIRIMTWGGLRGGVAVALALSIPQGATRDVILPMTYIVVLFSILCQGTTLKYLVRKAKFSHLKQKATKEIITSEHAEAMLDKLSSTETNT